MSIIASQVKESEKNGKEINEIFRNYLDDLMNDVDLNKISENHVENPENFKKNQNNSQFSSEMRGIPQTPTENDLDDLESLLESMIYSQPSSTSVNKNTNFSEAEDFIKKYSTSRT